ncbi:MAG: SorT family sulfite dehydrogenase catalytic subunit [Saccharospirillum sp.]
MPINEESVIANAPSTGVMTSRRTFITGSAGVLAGASLLSLTPAVHAQSGHAIFQKEFMAWKQADALIAHSEMTAETRRDAIGTGVVTPSDRLFVRNNLPAPPASITNDPDAWEVSIEGVNNPRTMTLAELKRLGVETVTSVLQCSGNGRKFFPHGPSGSPWETGAAGCVVWTGVPLREVVRVTGGVAPGMNYITGTGGEEIPPGIDPKTIMVERSVPTQALATAILAWGMNDEPLSLTHGGPLRLVIPGYYGVNNVKYIKRLAFTEAQSEANIQQSGYRVRDVGLSGSADQPSMWEMNVKSWVTTPLDSVPAGRNMIYGVAFGGVNALDRIEVSTDGGQRWHRARFLGPDMGQYAWRPFVFEAELGQGEHLIVTRATDVMGNTQPRDRVENHRGYGHNGWFDHGVNLNVV